MTRPSVFQQIIKDVIIATPGGSSKTKIERNDSNRGVAVKLSTDQTSKNERAFSSVVVEKTGLYTDKIFGILGDFHDDDQCTIIRKGRVIVSSYYNVIDRLVEHVFIGKKIFPGIPVIDGNTLDSDYGKCAVPNQHFTSTTAIGKILGVGTHKTIGPYYIVDLNLPLK